MDLPEKTRSGLVDALHILKGIDGIAQIYLTEKDVVPVSYTHLAAVNINGIAFRLLVEISADVIAAGGLAQAKAGMAGALLHLGQLLAFQYGNGNVRVAIHGVGPVSYTHLDVYKRQVRG